MNVNTLPRQYIDICRYDFVEHGTLKPMTEVTAAETALDQGCCPPLLGPTLDDDAATELAATLKSLADPIRLKLINLIAGSGEVCACDLPALLDRTQPTTSHHLSQLVKAGFLAREQRGKWAWFRVRQERLAAVSQVLCGPSS